MGVNFHSSYTTSTLFKTGDMNPPLESLDKAISHTKSLMITCAGSLSWDSTSLVLSWDEKLKLIGINEDTGKIHINYISSGSITLNAAGDIVYADMTTDAGDNISATYTSFSTASTMLQPSSRIVLGMIDTTSVARFYPSPALMPVIGVLT